MVLPFEAEDQVSRFGTVVCVGRGVLVGGRVAVGGGVREMGAGAQLPKIRVISKSEMKRLVMAFLL